MSNSHKDLTPPERLERRLLADYPALDEYIERMLSAKAELHWPDWCYLPMSASFAIVSGGAERRIAQRYVYNSIHDLEAISAIIPWRLYKVIYNFDRDLIEELTAKDTLPESIPAVLLQHLPYPCIYISDPPGIDDCDGMFAFLEWDHRYPEAMELRLHYLFGDGEVIPLFYQFADDRMTLGQKFAENIAMTGEEIGGYDNMDEKRHRRWEQCAAKMNRHLSMLVYICSDEPDVSRISDIPRRRGRGAIKTPNWPDKINVGHYIGSTIRMGREAQRRTAMTGHGGGSTPRPHVRRAHWHLYWTGEGRKVPRVKWLAPIFVSGETAGNMPVVEHAIK